MNLRFQVLHFLVGQISFRISYAPFAFGSGLKENNCSYSNHFYGIHESSISLSLKQIFFLRILQTFDTRLRKLRTGFKTTFNS